MSESPEPAAAPRPPATLRDRLLLGAFWTWAALLVLLTLAQLFGWKGVLDVLDVKNWFSR